MAGPWEQYSKPTAPEVEQSGPWEAYKEAPTTRGSSGEPPKGGEDTLGGRIAAGGEAFVRGLPSTAGFSGGVLDWIPRYFLQTGVTTFL